MITETYQVFVNEDPEKIAVTTSTEKLAIHSGIRGRIKQHTG